MIANTSVGIGCWPVERRGKMKNQRIAMATSAGPMNEESPRLPASSSLRRAFSFAAGVQLLMLLIALLFGSVRSATAQTFGCTPAMANDIVCENSKPGNPSSDWDVEGGGDDTIQGFATSISVNQGQTVYFK